jgi:hypothetical protein
MKKLLLVWLWAGMLLCFFSATALAQSDEATVPYCGELAAEECAALEATTERMAGLTSGTSENQVRVYFTGGPLRDREVSLELSTASSFVMEPETLARLQALKTMTPEALHEDLAAAADLELLPLAIDIDQTTTVAFSPELVTLLSERLGADIPATLAFHTRIIDNVLYVRLADYAVFGTQPAWVPEWVGIQLTAMLSGTITSAVAEPEFDVLKAQAELVAPGMAMAPSVVYDIPAEQVAAYTDFMHLSALGITEMEGVPVNTYRLTWNIPRYVGGPLFAQQVGLATEEAPSPASLVLGMLASVLFHGLQAEVLQVVGVEDAYLYQVVTRVEWQIAIAGGPALAESPTIGFISSTTNRELNQVASIPVPEDAVVPPLNLLIQTFRRLNR